MAVTVTVLNQKKVPGIGLFTAGRVNYSGTYPAGGESNAGLLAVLSGHTNIDNIQFGATNDVSAWYDTGTGKLRVSKLAAGVNTEIAAAAYSPTTGTIPFTIISR